MERQGFDAEMKIHNTTESGVIDNVAVIIKVTDEYGVPVAVSDNSNDTSAKFFVRLSNKENIANVDGSGVVASKTTGVVNWLLIPAPGSAGTGAAGKKYLVGATLKYRFGGADSVLELDPDVITVKPLPLLTLDYFLTKDVVADDPFTPQIEAAEPFTLGVRIKNNGLATAKNMKIDSAQPKIIENKQGLLINFLLTGSYINDAPAQKSLLLDFGDIAGNSSKMGRWNMETTLAGKFEEFTARFTHADELGGALTSILQATNTHPLIHDVRVDLPGRDNVRDFLAQDGDVIRVYESDGADTIVTNRSAAASLTPVPGSSNYRLTFPATAGFAYAKVADPFKGTKTVGTIVRSDAKQLGPENTWLSKARNTSTNQWDYYVNFFDVNTTGAYDSAFDVPDTGVLPPVMQFIADRTVEVGKQTSFMVEASSPAGKAVTISAAPLPGGAKLVAQAADPAAPGLARAAFDWTPPAGSAGTYPITFSASDGALSVKRVATVTVKETMIASGPGTPSIALPRAGATNVEVTRTDMQVQTSMDPNDKTFKIQYELYLDEAGTNLFTSSMSDKPPQKDASGATVPVPTTWTLLGPLAFDTTYWWRARATDGTHYSPWVYSHFRTASIAPAPAAFNQTSPAPDAVVSSLNPVLAWTNSAADKNASPVSYAVTVYKDAALTEVVATVANVPESASGTTSWTVQPALTNLAKYYWRVVATRALGAINTATPAPEPVGAKTSSTPRAFTVNSANRAPGAPVLVAPAAGISASLTPTLSVEPAVDPEQDALTYVFEIDSANTFDSPARRSSGKLAGGAGRVNWVAPALTENTLYWWRVKAQDAQGESAWTQGSFRASVVNEAPAVPKFKNPGADAWTTFEQPILEAFAAADPEGDAVSYQFEVYSDTRLASKVASGTSPNTSLVVPVPLLKNTKYWWRIRALDPQGAASNWSLLSAFTVGSGGSQGPTIALTTPTISMLPDLVTAAGGIKKQVTLRWEGTDPNLEPTVSLYYGTDKGSYTGTPIVENLRQGRGIRSGSYVWDVSTLAPGAYRVYAKVFDSRGMGQAYAQGAVVIPHPVQSAGMKVLRIILNTTEGAGRPVTVMWGKMDTTPAFLPVAGNGNHWQPIAPVNLVSGNRSTFTVYPYQCSKQAAFFPVTVGPVSTDDPDFAGQVAQAPDTGIIKYMASNTGDETLRVCDIRILSSRVVSGTLSDYTVSARLSNLGAGLASALATPSISGADLTATGTLKFGTIAAGETGSSETVVTVRAPTIDGSAEILKRGLQWSVQLTR
ncbi:putative Ig domain-containing protein [Massilia sp. CCM 8734]|uniref:putative Ig domain-containing protein n=1 Tax=Massilia sp. CCM 8734 TaxID=2609283 RepID=UPI001423E387|nr:putative Ig domain-containing protein [Massilia sp. CCM 8734]NHZ99845.1 hypothetical protein [Massilia sp. CCM 8734]